MQNISNTTPELNYYRRQQYQSGWQDLLDIMISGVAENASDEDRRQFLNLMGNRLADRFPLNPAETVGDLEDQINRLWCTFHWGFVTLQPGETHLILIHRALPSAAPGAQAEQWLTGLAAVLEGAYAQWLLAQGGQPHVALLWQQDSADGTMTFSYQNSL
ncbi:cellulose biosynthesis protein BcsD [Acerihabitans sp. TG2]|uniref:cellulose biosynthesis protein BcsD n=1 Tax=Acerihabitans sp. TG2 TaxID=3096008 RepID=UPI002B2235C3|nr:cellulose biosynthesis protein BcsD [Acerihabitans sp. TG2]MEA9389916.1 cellulose biosynthesis protein BcsD [Acerihabitans sp. TG2]